MLPLTSRHRERIVDREVKRLELATATRRCSDAGGASRALLSQGPAPAGRPV